MSGAFTAAKGVAWVTLANIFGKLIILGNLYLILTHLSVYEYGLSELVLSAVSLMSAFLLPGLSSAVVADLGVERANGRLASMKALFLQFLTFNASLSIVAWAVLFFFAPMVAHQIGNDAIGSYLQIASFLFLLSPLRLASTMLATAQMRYADQSFFSVVEEIGKGLLLLVLFFGLGRTLDALFIAAVGSQILAILVFLPRTISAYRMMGTTVDQPLAFWKSLRTHHRWSIAASYGSTVVQATQLWIVRFFFGTEAVGLYAFASGIVAQVSSLLPLSAVLGPLVPSYVDRREELVRLIRACLKVQFVVSLILIVGTLLVLPFFVAIFPKYEPSVPLIVALLSSVVLSGAATVFTPVFVAFKEQRSLLISVLVKLAYTVILMPLGIFLFGMPGIGVSVVAVLFMSVLERYSRLKRLLPGFRLSPKDFFSVTPEERGYGRMVVKRLFHRLPFTARTP